MLIEKFLEFVYIHSGWFIILAILLGYLIYKKSVDSRKYYKCPNCGEKFYSEHMKSKTCNTCGTQLEEIDKNNNLGDTDND